MIFKKCIMTVLTTLGLVCISTAEANMISGQLWRVSDGEAKTASADQLAAVKAKEPLPDVTFDVDSLIGLYFDSRSGGDDEANYTVGSWLNTGGATNIVYTPGGGFVATDRLGKRGGGGAHGVLVEFTGFVTVTNGETILVGHDDGITLTIGDEPDHQWTLPSPDQTELKVTTGTYNGPSGNQPFKLIYGECCTAPAILQVTSITLPNPPNPPTVPEPATLTLMSLGLAGIGVVRHRRRRG